MTAFTRADWGARPANKGPGNLDPAKVEGVALHWPAMSKPLTTVDAVKAALRGWQSYHMDDHRWSDIAYQLAFDQAGNRYILRGIAAQSGANGDTDVNERFGAFLLVLAPGEEPSPEMVAAVQAAVAEHRALFPHSVRIVGHGEIRPGGTDCPGAEVRAALAAGVFEPATKPTRVSRARKHIRRAIRELEATPEPRKGAHNQADVLRTVLRTLPER